MPYGYNGKILRVNLSNGEIWQESPDETVYRTYMGGSALSLYYLLNTMGSGVDPLGPENTLVFMSSIISGAPLAGLSRYTVAARSPLTGAFGEAEAGGFWGPELKFAGFDGIVIQGCAPKPSYLWINDGNAEIRDASRLWGKDTGEVEHIIREDLGDKLIRVAQCGKAGENLVRYACVLNELSHVNGRTGMGAVMGSKNLRAVAVRGTQSLSFSRPDKVKEISRKLTELIPKAPIAQNYRKYGTAILISAMNEMGILPTRNFKEGKFEGSQAISGEVMTEKILLRSKGCYSCGIHCKRSVRVEGKYTACPEYGGPEYETLAALGSLCAIDNLEAIAQGNDMCNRWGLDSISTGVAVAFAMECTERGVLSRQDTDGIDLRFGNAGAMLQMIEKIANNDGFGAVLAQGVKRASKQIGKGSESYAMHIKGQELPLHDPRGKKAVMLSYAISPTGADHIEAPHDTAFMIKGATLSSMEPLGFLEPISPLDSGPRKIRLFVLGQQIFSLFNSIGMCNFAAAPYSAFTLPLIAEVVEAITGWNTSLYELMELGERAINMARMFNTREGFSSKEDCLPERLFETLEKGTPAQKSISREEFARALRLYYEAMGWDPKTGAPGEGKLALLGLEWLAELSKK